MYYCTSPKSFPQTDIFSPAPDELSSGPTVPREGDWAKDASDELEVRS